MTPYQHRLALTLYFTVAIASFVILLALIGIQIYIRWFVNQNFSFLPGAGFEALVVLVLGELLGFAYLLQAGK